MTAPRITITDLVEERGFTIGGGRPGSGGRGEELGDAIVPAGDVNGDGIDDILIGARSSSFNVMQGGEAFVIYGQADTRHGLLDINLLTEDDGFRIFTDTPRTYFGINVAAGDINDDGLSDLAVIAPTVFREVPGTGEEEFRGEVFVVYGEQGTSRGPVNVNNLTTSEGVVFQGATSENLFFSGLSASGDINGDGVVDLLIGSPTTAFDGARSVGTVYAIYGGQSWDDQPVALSNLAQSEGFTIDGTDPDPIISAGNERLTGGAFGLFSIPTVDLNGDGIDDIIVSSVDPNGGTGGFAYTGEVNVIYGQAGTSRGNFSVEDLPTSDGFRISGPPFLRDFGRQTSSVGDVNGDGIEDLIVGATSVNTRSNATGDAYVIFGQQGTARQSFNVADMSADDGFVIEGFIPNFLVGSDVAGAGDVNGDGYDDLLVLARGSEDVTPPLAAIYLIYGRPEGLRENIDLENFSADDGIIINGIEGMERRYLIDAAGDINNDGVDDFVIATTNFEGETPEGEVNIIYGFREIATAGGDGGLEGSAFDDTMSIASGRNIIIGKDGDDILAGGLDDDDISGGGGNDILIGDNASFIAGRDTLNGGTGDDLMQGGAGVDTFVFTTGDGNDTIGAIALDYGDLANSTVSGADFESGVDKINLNGFGLADGAAALALVSDVDGVATFADQGTTITFAGLSAADLSADDFVIV